MTGGRFITFEGIDGSGKSTQAKTLASALAARGSEVVLTREPGGAPGAEDIRRLLVEGEPGRWSAETEILLFTAARRDHLERTIAPALDAGKTVISDRFVDSTRVYQGVARADLRQTVDTLHELSVSIEPDLTIILDMDPEIALGRGIARNTNEDRFEKFGLDFHRRLKIGFLALAVEYSERCVVIPASGEPDEIAEQILAAVDRA